MSRACGRRDSRDHPFTEDGQVDHAFLARRAQWQVERAASAWSLGSLGESATLSCDEKVAWCAPS